MNSIGKKNKEAFLTVSCLILRFFSGRIDRHIFTLFSFYVGDKQKQTEQKHQETPKETMNWVWL